MNKKQMLYLVIVFLLIFGGTVAHASEITYTTFIPLDRYNLNMNLKSSLYQTPKVFYYERTFGVTEVAYLADTAHIYNPEGVGVDSAGNLWVAETLGARLLK